MIKRRLEGQGLGLLIIFEDTKESGNPDFRLCISWWENATWELCFYPGLWGRFSGTRIDNGTHSTCLLSSVLSPNHLPGPPGFASPRLVFGFLVFLLLISPICAKFNRVPGSDLERGRSSLYTEASWVTYGL